MPPSVREREESASVTRGVLDGPDIGEEIVIARNGRPVAQLVPVRRERPRRVPGSLRGRIRISPGAPGA